jgi:hypothetical protein
MQPPIPGQFIDIATIVARRLARSSGRRGFGNARSVRSLLETSLKHASARITSERINGTKHEDADRVTLHRIDVLGKPFKLDKSKHFSELNALLGLAKVKAAVKNLSTMVVQNLSSEERGEDVLDVSLHRIFLGNPGTGTT